MHDKAQEMDDLDQKLRDRDALIAQYQNELGNLEEQRRLEEEAKRRREQLERERRKWYIPVKGDKVDELMATHLNNCMHYVPVSRMDEG